MHLCCLKYILAMHQTYEASEDSNLNFQIRKLVLIKHKWCAYQ